MALPDLTGQDIEKTYQRIVHTDGVQFYNGTGSVITFTATATAGGSNTQIQFNSASLLSGSSNFSFDYINNNILLTGSILMSGSSHISGVDYIDFDLTASNPGAVGRLKWNDNDGTLDLGLKGGNVTLQIGQEEVVRVVNDSGVNLTEAGYQVVRITGAQGGRVKVALAKGDGDPNSLDTLGLVTEDIANNQEGYVTVSGLVRKIDTRGISQGETWNEGDALYLSPTVFGGITNIPPTAPSHSVRLGYVVQKAPNGSIFVKVDNGYEIDELHNVLINTSSLSYGDLLMYDSNVWYNTKTLSGSYTLSGSLVTNDGVWVQSLTASFVSASSITGSLFGTASFATSASWAPATPPGGTTNDIQYNGGGFFAGENNFTYYSAGSSNNFRVVELMNGSPDPDPDSEGTEAGLKLKDASSNGWTHTFTTAVDCPDGVTTTIFSLDTSAKTLGATCNYTIVDPLDFTSIRTGQLFVSFDGTSIYTTDTNNKGGNNAEASSGRANFSFDYNGSLGRIKLVNTSPVTLRVIVNATTFTTN